MQSGASQMQFASYSLMSQAAVVQLLALSRDMVNKWPILARLLMWLANVDSSSSGQPNPSGHSGAPLGWLPWVQQKDLLLKARTGLQTTQLYIVWCSPCLTSCQHCCVPGVVTNLYTLVHSDLAFVDLLCYNCGCWSSNHLSLVLLLNHVVL